MKIQPLHPHRLPALKKQGGFTLVEITMALGIVSVVILSMLGVMSVGLNTIKESSDDTMHAQIIARVSSTALQTPFDKINDLATGVMIFDQAGRTVENSQDSMYQAKLEIVPGSSSAYPGAPSTLDASAKTVKITVSTKPPGAQNALSSSYATIIVPHS